MTTEREIDFRKAELELVIKSIHEDFKLLKEVDTRVKQAFKFRRELEQEIKNLEKQDQ